VTRPEYFYDSIAGDFDALMNPYDLRRRLEVVFDDLLGAEPLTGRRVLDVGCGTGHFSLAATARGAEVVSVDIGIELLRTARGKGVGRVVTGDAGALPFPGSSFDVVVSSECIEHTVDPERSVAEMLRVLRPDGLLALTCPNRTWHWSVVVANALKLRPYRGLENWPSRSTLRRWIENRHARVLRHVGIHCFPFTLALTHPLLRRLDAFGSSLGIFYVNQAVLTKLAGRPAFRTDSE
jgi:ubiquinone/menaquinone biosynthesis C-methylase UbiE